MQNMGGVIGIGFEFLGIAGFFTAAGIYLDGRFAGRGLILFALVIVGVSAGLWHMIRRVKSIEIEMPAQKKIQKPEKPEDHLRKLDEMTRSLEEMTRKKKDD